MLRDRCPGSEMGISVFLGEDEEINKCMLNRKDDDGVLRQVFDSRSCKAMAVSGVVIGCRLVDTLMR